MKKLILFLIGVGLTTYAFGDDGVYRQWSSGRTTVTTNGTRVQLSSSSVGCGRIVVMAETDNTNPVTVGSSDVVGALATRKGIALDAGEALTVRVGDLSKVYIDSVTDTEGVTWVCYN